MGPLPRSRAFHRDRSRRVGAAAARRAQMLCALLALACGAPKPPPAPRLLLLVTVDTLRADRLGAYGSDRGLTPFLDQLAQQALVFESAYAPAPFTVPSLLALHTGRHPLEMGLRTNLSTAPDEIVTLAQALASEGWHTGAVVSNVVLRGRRDVARGFEVYDDTLPQQEAVRRWPERIAAGTTDAALHLLDAWQRDPRAGQHPLFLWVHYMDPHGPYTPPPGWRERLLPAEIARSGDRTLAVDETSFGEGALPAYQVVDARHDVAFYRAGYDAEVAYLDQEIARLFAGLAARDLRDRARWVFAADHGEALGEHDFWFAHGHHLTDELVHVPLLLGGPDLSPGRRSDVVSLLDLLPTLLSRVAPEALPDGLRGRDLLAPDALTRDSTLLLSTLSAYTRQRVGLVSDGYKLILTHDGELWSSQLFRLGHEDVDLSAPAPQLARRMRQQLRAERERLDTGVAEARHAPDEAERRALEALGYVHGDAP